MDEDEFHAAVDRLCGAGHPGPGRLGAAMLVAAALGMCSDSRAFARRFDVAHALVLRECTTLAEEPALIELGECDERTRRQAYRLSGRGRELIESVEG